MLRSTGRPGVGWVVYDAKGVKLRGNKGVKLEGCSHDQLYPAGSSGRAPTALGVGPESADSKWRKQ